VDVVDAARNRREVGAQGAQLLVHLADAGGKGLEVVSKPLQVLLHPRHQAREHRVFRAYAWRPPTLVRFAYRRTARPVLARAYHRARKAER
jgi:hypothetical protein